MGGLIGFIITVVIIINGKNKNPWLWGGILTAVGLPSVIFSFMADPLNSLGFIAFLMIIVGTYFITVAVFAVTNIFGIESNFLYVFVFYIVQGLIFILIWLGVVEYVNLQGFPRRTEPEVEFRDERENVPSRIDGSREQLENYDVENAEIIKCVKNENLRESGVPISQLSTVHLHHSDEYLLKYDSLVIIDIPDDELREEKAFRYQMSYESQYGAFDESESEFDISVINESLFIFRTVNYYLMDLQKVYETSGRFRSATNADYTININKVVENYNNNNWQCE